MEAKVPEVVKVVQKLQATMSPSRGILSLTSPPENQRAEWVAFEETGEPVNAYARPMIADDLRFFLETTEGAWPPASTSSFHSN